MPDEKVDFVMNYIYGIKGANERLDDKTEKAKEALKRIRAKRVSVPADTDYDKIYREAALAEKYENISCCKCNIGFNPCA